MQRGFSLHVGSGVPHGILDTTTDPGPTINLDLVFPIVLQLGWDVRLGYSLFTGSSGASDVDIWNFSANLKYLLASTTPWPFVNGGIGLYYVDNNDLEGGANLGVGVGQSIGPNLTLEVTANYHTTFTASPDLRFTKVQIGLIRPF